MNSARVWFIGASMLSVVGAARLAHADRALEVSALGKVSLRIDGDVRDWRGAHFVALGDAADGSLEYALAYDSEALYVAARVADDELVRSAHPSPAEDALVLTLALPRAHESTQVSDVWLYAGVAGRQRAEAAVAAAGEPPRPSAAIAVAEGPLAERAGYVLEARVPWSAIPGGREAMVGRGALALHDVDGQRGAHATTLATATLHDGAALPPLLFEGGAHAAIADFLRKKQLASANIHYDLDGDVVGDARLERIVLAGTFLVVAGPDVQGGGGFHYMDLPVTSGAALQHVDLHDFTGDGKDELALRFRQDTEFGTRDLYQVLDLSKGQARPLLTLPLRRDSADGFVEAELLTGSERAGKPIALEVRIGRARGLDAEHDHDEASPGIEPLLTPWGAWQKRIYSWDGARFAVSEQKDNPAFMAREPAQPGGASATSPAPSAQTPALVHAAPPGAAELIEAFRAARGVDPALKPRFTQHANFAEDAALESLLIFGSDLLLIGKGYRGGTGYFYFGLPVHAAADIERVFTGDVTGDGRREVFVRIEQQVGDVQREILLGYTFSDSGMDPILAVEVRRAQGEHSIGNRVALVKEHGHFALTIAPGAALGWDEHDYPFVAESLDSYGPLLLPWKDPTLRYRFDGGHLVGSPAH